MHRLLTRIEWACIRDALRNLVRLVQFLKCKEHPWRSVTMYKVAG